MNRVLASAGLALVLVGCAHTPPAKPPAAIAAAVNFNHNGIVFESNGNRDHARTAFEESRRLSASVEYTAGEVAALINLARLDRRAGDLTAARRQIEQATAKIDADSQLKHDLAFESALIDLADNDMDAARRAADATVATAPAKRRGAAMALRARILAVAGESSAARSQAREALRRCDDAGLLLEAANSARLLGDLAAASDGAEAERYYLQALDYDRRAAISPRIAEDLRRLAAARRTLGDRAGAIAYLQRASDVALNNRSHAAAADDLSLLATLYRQQGDTQRADACERLRQTLAPDSAP